MHSTQKNKPGAAARTPVGEMIDVWKEWASFPVIGSERDKPLSELQAARHILKSMISSNKQKKDPEVQSSTSAGKIAEPLVDPLAWVFSPKC